MKKIIAYTILVCFALIIISWPIIARAGWEYEIAWLGLVSGAVLFTLGLSWAIKTITD